MNKLTKRKFIDTLQLVLLWLCGAIAVGLSAAHPDLRPLPRHSEHPLGVPLPRSISPASAPAASARSSSARWR